MHPLISQSINQLSKDNLLDCIILMRQYALEKKTSFITDALESIERSYRLLLKYLSEGAEDQYREKMYNSIRYDLFTLVKNQEIEELIDSSPMQYFSTLRTVRFSKLSFGDALGRFLSSDASLQLTQIYDGDGNLNEEARKILNEKDRAIKDIFSIVWTLPAGEKKQMDEVVNIASDSDISFQLRGVIVSALILSFLQVPDVKKLISLLDIDTKSIDPGIKARALTGIVIGLSMHASIVSNDYDLGLRFSAWRDDLSNYPRLRNISYSLARTRGSRKLNDKINSEILPGLNNIGKELFKDFGNRETPISIEELQENPAWEKAMRESGLDKKMKKIHKMHNKGADMMLSMFTQLSYDRFFKDIDVWFRPFEEWEIARLEVDPKLSSLVAGAPSSMFFCDPDKYAMLIHMSHMNPSMREMMGNAFNSGREQMEEELKDKTIFTNTPEFDIEAVNYARTLFRFFNYYRLKKEFRNPFEKAIDFASLPYVGSMLAEDEILHSLGEIYFQQEYYHDAVNIFSLLASKNQDVALMLLEKIGYCHEKDNNYPDALEYYIKADNLKQDEDQWLLERIYKLAKLTNKKELLIDTLNRLLVIDINNLTYLEEWLKIMIEMNVYSKENEVVMNFEKNLARLLYLSPENEIGIRLKADTSALKGEWEKIIELNSHLINDVELYLAASSLGGGEENDLDQEKNMRHDLLLLASAQIALERYSDAIESLKLARMLKHPVNSEDITNFIKKTLINSPLFSNHYLMIPIVIEASGIQ